MQRHRLIIQKSKYQKQMRNRNTIGDQWKPPRNYANSVERKTLTTGNPNIGASHARHHTQAHTNEQMARLITETLLKIPNQNSRASICTSLKANQKTLMSTISNFLYSIDRNFQDQYLDFDAIVSMAKFWGYPYNINKTIFQPVGAPHTWHNCLQIMHFLAELTNYFFEYKIQLQDTEFERSYNDLELEAFRKDDLSELENYHATNIAKLQKTVEELCFKNESNQLTLRNIKNSQRSLEVMEQEESQLQQKLDRQTQNVIEVDQKNTAHMHELQKLDDLIDQANHEQRTLHNRIALLEKDITNQQLSYEEANKIELEIKEYQIKINKLKQKREDGKLEYDRATKQNIGDFLTLQNALKEITSSIQRYESQLVKRNIDMPRPEVNHNLLSELNEDDLGEYKEKLERLLQKQSIQQMLTEQETLANVLEVQIRRQKSQINDIKLQNKTTAHEEELLRIEVQKLKSLSAENERQILNLESINKVLDENNSRLNGDKQSWSKRRDQLASKKEELTAEINSRKEQMMQGIAMSKQSDEYSEKIIKDLENKYAETKKKVEVLLERLYDGYRFLNQDLGAE